MIRRVLFLEKPLVQGDAQRSRESAVSGVIQ